MEVLVISASDSPLQEAPAAFVEAIVTGKGGYIKIEPNSPPPKVLWTLKALLQAIGTGFQWSTISRLVAKGMHGEWAEAHVTAMVNKLIKVEVPALPSREEMESIKKRLTGGVPPEPKADLEPDFEEPSEGV